MIAADRLSPGCRPGAERVDVGLSIQNGSGRVVPGIPHFRDEGAHLHLPFDGVHGSLQYSGEMDVH